MSDVEITETETKRQWKRWVRFPTKLYRGSKFYVHPLELDEKMLFSTKNPSCEHFIIKAFLAHRGKKIVGRIAVLIPQHPEALGHIARFTRFDFIDDTAVSSALIHAAESYARRMGMKRVAGPLGFNDFDKEGLLIHGCDRIGNFETIYNYAYYQKHIESAGFKKETDWLEFTLPMPDRERAKRFEKISEHTLKRLDLHVLPQSIGIKDVLARHEHDIFDLLNHAYGHLHAYVPTTPEVRAGILKQFKKIIRREYLCLVFDRDMRAVGFAIVLPNIARSINRSQGRLLPFGWLRIMREIRRPRYLDMALIAVHEDFRNKGINAVMIHSILKECENKNIIGVETNLELETNTQVLAQTAAFDKTLIRRRRCYTKELG